jgi:NADPH-dependent glutamate synthase beta subunit-like oxidoreductase/ferredoxin
MNRNDDKRNQMLKLNINNEEVRVPEGITVMAAARMKGFDVPSMCYRDGKPHFTSCMICMVKDNKSGKLFPSCSVKVVEGMDIATRDAEIEESRKTALELLLSEHTGDCEAPCQVTCPAHMDIPLMNRLLAEGKFGEALKVVKQDIALPGVFGRICPAPCEGACRRKSVDTAVSICLLKRYAGDHDMDAPASWLPEKLPVNGKKVAIIGAGPAGLAAAYYLQLRGYQCDVYFRGRQPGGSLWSEVTKGVLPERVLEHEIGLIRQLGAWMYPDTYVDPEHFRELMRKFDTILIATGSGETGVETWGLEMTDKGIAAGKSSYATSLEKIFAAGCAVRNSKLAIRTLGLGKEAAFSIDQYLQGKEVTGEPFLFNSRFGKLVPEEIVEYLKESVEGNRLEPSDVATGFTREEVMQEAARCLHCDCRELTDCKLRLLSDEYRANQKRYWSEDRRLVSKRHFGSRTTNKSLPETNVPGSILKSTEQDGNIFVIYEPNKCIKCGICVRITEEHKETFGMSFIGRGFDVVIGVPFGEALENGLEKVARQVVEECPTGALTNR